MVVALLLPVPSKETEKIRHDAAALFAYISVPLFGSSFTVHSGFSLPSIQPHFLEFEKAEEQLKIRFNAELHSPEVVSALHIPLPPPLLLSGRSQPLFSSQ